MLFAGDVGSTDYLVSVLRALARKKRHYYLLYLRLQGVLEEVALVSHFRQRDISMLLDHTVHASVLADVVLALLVHRVQPEVIDGHRNQPNSNEAQRDAVAGVVGRLLPHKVDVGADDASRVADGWRDINVSDSHSW